MNELILGFSRWTRVCLLFGFLLPGLAAAIEECRNPTPDQRFQMDLCAAHAGCAIDVGLADACASLTSKIKAYFSGKKQELDPGEYKSDRDAPLGPSEQEQARKDAELYRRNRALEASEARDAFNQITVADRSIKQRIERYCAKPMDQLCQNAVSEVPSLKDRADAFNANPAFVNLRGRITLTSLSVATPYAKIHSDYWDEYNKKADEARKRRSEEAEARQKKLEEERQKKELGNAPDERYGKILPDGTSNSSSDTGALALPRRGDSSATSLLQQAIGQSGPDASQAARDADGGARGAGGTSSGANAGASESRQEQLARSYDQRIASAREQCGATETSCQKGCLGVAALGGLLSFFSSSSAGLSATSEQTQLCSNRCTEAKSSCDEQVAALEQEKAQALTEAASQAVASAPGAATQFANGGVCAIDEGLFQSHAAASQAWSRHIKFRPASTEKIREEIKTIQEGYRNLSPERLQSILKDRQNYIANPNVSGVIAPMAEEQKRMSMARVKLEISMLECEQNRRQNASASAKPSPVAVSSVGAGSCQSAYDRQEAENAPIVRRIQSTSSAVTQMQLLLGMLNRRMALLDQSCRGQPQYAEYPTVKQQYAATLRNCRGIASNPADCVPK